MRNVLFSIAIIAFTCSNATAAPDTLFLKANALYSSGEFEEAFNTYREITESGVTSSSLYYNMGNAAYRSNRLGYAILYYEKALKLDPRNTEALRNLEFVSMYREDKLEAVPELFLKRWYRSLVQALSVNNWSIVSIALFVLILACTLAYIFGRRLWLKKTGFFTGITALLLFLISLTAVINRHRQFADPERAIIISPSVVVKSTPAAAGTDLFVLHEGTSVTIDEAVGTWTEIRISDGRIGWLPSKTIEPI
jgi:tetratricopeptide (TPR) repeat protein